jgi:hypothetical protein
MTSKWLFNVVALVVIVVFAMGAQCPRECESNRQCQRQCDCTNEDTDLRTSCTMGFICTSDEVCEADYSDMSCDTMCGRYAANNICGRDRCTSNDQCTRVVSCSVPDANGRPTDQLIDCKFEFACDVTDSETCDPRSTLSPAQLCVTLPAEACLPP